MATTEMNCLASGGVGKITFRLVKPTSSDGQDNVQFLKANFPFTKFKYVGTNGGPFVDFKTASDWQRMTLNQEYNISDATDSNYLWFKLHSASLVNVYAEIELYN